MFSRWKTSTPCSRCSGLTAPPPKPTTTSATRWRTALPYIFGASSTICGLDPDADDEKRLLRGTIVAAVNKMYLDCCFVAMRQEEALWPGILGDLQ